MYAFDNYDTGWLTDFIENVTFTPSKPRFAAAAVPVIAPGQQAQVAVSALTANHAASPSQTGLLLRYRDSEASHESQVVTVVGH